MKKTSKKRVIVSVALAALLFAAAITAYAVSWSDSGSFKGVGYMGDYSAAMDLTSDYVSASLSVSDYFGFTYVGGGAEIKGYAYASNGDQISLDRSVSEDSCSISRTPFGSSTFLRAQCSYSYMSIDITSHDMDLS